MSKYIDDYISVCREHVQDFGATVHDYLKSHPKAHDRFVGLGLTITGYMSVELGKYLAPSPSEFVEKGTPEQIAVFALVSGGILLGSYGVVTVITGYKNWLSKALDNLDKILK